ncbi:MAG TPA: methyltransferase domain-containing protein [Candidatus Paceibacterota bacterium]|nr:methyltransferase domain-containing protein [Candidatus Paceibacterota bacterium]
MAFADPRINLQKLNLAPGMTVVDFGAGVGTYSLAAASLVDSEDKVYAVEIQKDLLETIKRDAKARNLHNVEVIWGDIEQANGVSLPDSIADVVIISNVLFQAKSMYTMALEAKRLLKPNGRIMVIEWSESFSHLGPVPSDVVPAEEVKKTFGSAGLAFTEEFVAGDHHYGLIFFK